MSAILNLLWAARAMSRLVLKLPGSYKISFLLSSTWNVSKNIKDFEIFFKKSDLVDPGWPWTSKILMEVLLLEGNSSSFQLNGYCISESKILRRMIFINGSRRGWNRIERIMESIRFMSVLWLIFVKNFVLKFKIYFLKYFEISNFSLEIFTLEDILKYFFHYLNMRKSSGDFEWTNDT